MTSSESPRKLVVRDKAVDLVVEVYRLSNMLPKTELYGLTSQLRRAVVSVPANIVEGQERLHRRDFVRCLSIARGSLAEVEVLLEIADRLGYIPDSETTSASALLKQVGRMLNGLIRSLSDSLDDPLHGR
jgi:four helix bundle protein